jgi:hypothetical protein
MERRHQARTPVNINALLIGEKTVPKGCRVMDVSQNGMQLHCEADGRLLTFKDGDSVDVQLTVQQDGKQRKFTIPSWVRHVAANSVDVEFHHPDPLLVDLIESYRISENHKLEASLGRMDRRTANGRGAASLPDQPVKHPPRQNNRPFYVVILAAVFAVCVITGGYVYTASIDSRISTLETLTERQSTELTEIQSRILSASLQEGRYASLNARMTALGDAFASLENRLGQVLPPSTSTSAQAVQAAGKPAGEQVISGAATGPHSSVAVGTKPDQVPQENAGQTLAGTVKNPAISPARTPTSSAARVAIARPSPSSPVTGETATGADAQPQPAPAQAEVPPADTGPWVINLLSSPDKAYIERFSEKSGAGKHNAQVNSAMVNGRQYWRLQIAGFESAAKARNHAVNIKQELGIKDVWIFKQK